MDTVDIVDLVAAIVGAVAKAGTQAIALHGANVEAVKAAMVAALDEQRTQIMTIDADLAANDAAADKELHDKFDKGQ